MNSVRNTDRNGLDDQPRIGFSDIPLDAGTKGVLLDLDNTLYEYGPCHEAALKAVFDKHHSHKGATYENFVDAYKSAQKSVKARIPTHGASHSRLLYFQKLTEDRDGRTGMQEALDSDSSYWSAFHDAIDLRGDALDFIKRCKAGGIRICLVTDLTASVQFHKIVAIGAEGLFDLIVTSEEAGTEKPARAMFALALEKLNLGPEEVIMIGDDKRKDIDGAASVGIKAYMV